MTIPIERVWAMPSRRTFTIAPIKKLILDELGTDFVDPFPYPYRGDALSSLMHTPDESVNALAFDPPYSTHQLKVTYGNLGLAYDASPAYWTRLKQQISRVMVPGGKTISFGWDSNGIGKQHGFKITRILLVAHGSMHHDTICTVEKKMQARL